MTLVLAIYLGCGAVVGVLAGLLGIGGGTVIVPMLLVAFGSQNIPPQYYMPMALGTSLASIMFTSISSTWSQHKRGSVKWDIFRNITPGILVGTFFGGMIASRLPTLFLKLFFICFLFLIAYKMISKFQPKASRQMPKAAGTSLAGVVIGLVSSFVGIGGGSLSVPFMVYCNVPMHTAVGTSAAIGFPIAVAGTLGYVVSGWNMPDLPSYCLGFVNLYALLGIAAASVFTAPLGVRLSHSLPTAKLKKIFAFFLIIIALKMLWDLV